MTRLEMMMLMNGKTHLKGMDTKDEVCPECGDKGHTSRSHVLLKPGDKVLVLDDIKGG